MVLLGAAIAFVLAGTSASQADVCIPLDDEGCQNGDCQCYNGIQDTLTATTYRETDVDCGAHCAQYSLYCSVGQMCDVDGDCLTNDCNPDSLCNDACGIPCSQCFDSVMNGDETDVDCGGQLCASNHIRCDVGQVCEVDGDCLSGRCTSTCSNGDCQCYNGVQDSNDGTNFRETDVDCGAHCTYYGLRCDVDEHCDIDDDCRSNRCVYDGAAQTFFCFPCSTDPDNCSDGACNPQTGNCEPGIGLAENIDPGNDGSQYAWGENVGWISAEQDTDGDGNPDQGILVEDFQITGWMWGENIGWISLSCLSSGDCGDVPYGLGNDGGGVLSGYAWGEDVGWISFTCDNTASCATSSYGVTVDPATGEFSGKAWAENIGWISFDFADAAVQPYRIQTGWGCDPLPAVPSGSPWLVVVRVGEPTLLWSAHLGATGYDIVQGDLGTLRADGGYGSATDGCSFDNLPANSRTASGAVDPGEGLWYLVRPVNCGGSGTYDTGEPSQIIPRDGEIDTSGQDCD